MAYALDKTGTLAANKVNSELMIATGKIVNTGLVPKESLFFRKGLIVRSGVGNTGTLLQEGVHYILILPCTTLAAFWGKPIYGGIFLLTKQYANVYATYQTVGGIYARGTKPLSIDLYNPSECIRKTWEQVIEVVEPAKADLTLHMDTAGTMQVLMNTADAVTAEIQRLGRI